MKKHLFILLLILFVEYVFGFDFSGIWLLNSWYLNPEFCIEEDYSWGTDVIPQNSMEIAIDEERNELDIFGIGDFEINSITQISEDVYILSFYFDRGDFDVEYKFTLLSNREMIIENLTKSTSFIAEGNSKHYYRKSGPVDVEQYSDPIYAIYIGDNQTKLNKNEKIRLIGIKCSNKGFEDIENLQYWYVTENDEYGYVKATSVSITNL